MHASSTPTPGRVVPAYDSDSDAVIEEDVKRERDEIRSFVAKLSPDDIKSGSWFSQLLAFALDSYTNKVDWQYFQAQYEGVPADAIVDQRIKMAARYAAIEGGLSASAYTGAVAATIGSAGGASPATVPAAVTTMMVDVIYVTRLQLRLAYDIAVLYRVPVDTSDPDDLWKLIRVAFTIKTGEIAREGLVKVVPALMRPLIKRYFSGSTLTAAKALPVVGRHLLQRNVIKIGIPLVGVPVAVVVNRYTTIVSGRHARVVFRNEARILELAKGLCDKTTHPRLTLWVAWLVVMADGSISDDEALLIRHLVRLVRTHHEVSDEKFSDLIDLDPEDVWRRMKDEAGDIGHLVDAAERVADVDGPRSKRENGVISELRDRCQRRDDAANE